MNITVTSAMGLNKEVKVEAELSALADFKNRLAHIRMQDANN